MKPKNHRRKFIKMSSLAAAGTLFLPACSSSNSSSKESQAAAETVVKAEKEIGIQLYTLRDQLQEDLEGTIKKVAEIGYDYVELFGYANRTYFDLPVSDFYKMLNDNNLKIRSGHYLTGNTFEEPQQGTLVNGWNFAVEDAALAGQEYMVCAYLMPGERESINDYMALADQLNKAGAVCKSAGIQFAYHNHDFEFQEIDGQLPMDVLLQNTDPDLVKVELDLYWINRAGLDAVPFFEKYKGRIPLWHVKDMEAGGDQSFTEVGNGVIDFKSIFDNADLSGMEYFFVEQDVSDNPINSVTRSHEYLTNQIFS